MKTLSKLPSLKRFWRKQPLYIKRLFNQLEMREISERAWNLCEPPAVTRIFTEPSADGLGGSRSIPNPAQALDLYKRFRESTRLTLLLNKVELVNPSLIELRDRFDVPYSWRSDDIVCSFSSSGGSIGYHAGAEDGFIIQIAGSRRWRVWDRSHVEDSYQAFLLGSDEAPPLVEGRPQSAPILDCILESGDVLYTPALFAHEGETVSESVSISVAWKGVSYYHLFLASAGEIDFRHRKSLFELLPDFESYSPASSSEILRLVSEKAKVAGLESIVNIEKTAGIWQSLIKNCV